MPGTFTSTSLPAWSDALTLLEALLTAVPIQAATVMEPTAYYAPPNIELYPEKLETKVAWKNVTLGVLRENRLASPPPS
jgi:hypothetical protein